MAASRKADPPSAAAPKGPPEATPNAGRFIVLDGVDGCGKSTQAERLARALSEEHGRPALHLREPGSTPAGERLRALFLDPEVTLEDGVEALLVVAARRQMLRERVAPALAQGQDVVCERFHSSTYAYQGVAGGMGEESILALCSDWAGSPHPDLVVLLGLDPAVALARRGSASDRIEAKDSDYHARVAEGYSRYARTVPGCVVVDATGSVEEVHRRVLEEVRRACRATA